MTRIYLVLFLCSVLPGCLGPSESLIKVNPPAQKKLEPWKGRECSEERYQRIYGKKASAPHYRVSFPVKINTDSN